MGYRKLDSLGVSHLLMPLLAFVLLGAVGGTYFVVKSRAATNGSAAVAANVSCSQFTLNRIVHDSAGNNYDLNNDRYGGGDQCARNTDGGADFTVYDGGTGSTGSGVRAYPNLIRGCSNQSCYSNGWPKQESSLGSWLATGNITTNNAAGAWDANYDIWFNQSNSIGPSRGAEILINLNRKNRARPTGFYKHFTNVFGDNSYDLYFWRQSATSNGTTRTWNFLEFWRNTETSSTSNLSLNKFWDKATTITCPTGSACIHKDWYLTGIDTGFEIWSGGYGLNWHGVKIQ